MAKVLSFVLVLVIFFCFTKSQTLVKFYVSSVFGSDTNNGLQPDAPVLTLQAALDIATGRRHTDFPSTHLAEICLNGNNINGTITFANFTRLYFTTYNDTERAVLIWNQIEAETFYVANLEFVGIQLIATKIQNDKNSLTLRDVHIVNLDNAPLEITASTISAKLTNFTVPTILISTENDLFIEYSRFTQSTQFRTTNNQALHITNSLFLEITNTSPNPAIKIQNFSTVEFSETNITKNQAGIHIYCDPDFGALSLSLDTVWLDDNQALESHYFSVLGCSYTKLNVSDSKFGCSYRSDISGQIILPFPSAFDSIDITDSDPLDCDFPTNVRPGYQCSPLGPCFECSAGYYSNGSICRLCPVGTFISTPGQIACINCSGNSVSVPNRTICVYCHGSIVDDFTCVSIPTWSPTIAPKPPGDDNIYLYLVIAVNVVFAISVIIVGLFTYKASKERQNVQAKYLLDK